MIIATVAHMPDELGQAWLQHLRDFDAQHPGCHFNVLGDTPDKSIAEVVKMLEVNPALTLIDIIGRKQDEWTCGHVSGAMCAECFRVLARRANELAEENLSFRARYGAPP